MWYKNIAGRFFGLITKHECDRRTDRRTDGRTDGQTDGQNYDSQDRASIAASCGKKDSRVNNGARRRACAEAKPLIRSK